MPSSSERVVLSGVSALAEALAVELTGHGRAVVRDEAWEPAPAGAVWVAPDPREPAGGAAEEAHRFAAAALDAGVARVVLVVRSFASVRASAAFPEASAAGGAVLAEARSLAARAVGSRSGVATLAVGLLSARWDAALAAALAGSGPPAAWVAQRQGRLLEPREVGSALAFLLSPSAAILNGAVLTADSTLSTRL